MTRHCKVIIPSWAKLNMPMRVETGVDYPIYIGVQGLPLYAHILQKYRELGAQVSFEIILSEDAPELDPHLFDGLKITVRRLEQSDSIGQSVLAGLSDLAPGQHLVVHMADTLIEEFDCVKDLDVIHVQERSDLYRWTSIGCEDGRVRILSDRNEWAKASQRRVCVGLFVFSDAAGFKRQLQIALQEQRVRADPFFVAIERYSEAHPIRLVQSKGWKDYGHVDSYHQSKLSAQNLRHFNTLSYDADIGVVTKRSENTDAFRHQVRWFRQVPDELAYFLPRIFDSSDGQEPFITMELLSSPTLSELFVTQRLELGAWNDVARRIDHILRINQKYRFFFIHQRQNIARSLSRKNPKTH
jgi:hypothetical protein